MKHIGAEHGEYETVRKDTAPPAITLVHHRGHAFHGCWYTETMSDYSEEHIRIIRGMTMEQKLDAFTDLYWSAREIKAAGLRLKHPDWPEIQI
ncbi:MAG TPA: hypothetical protein PK869_01830, partial [Candidatus Hydrogenedentes bacterium]|nr:hypothetical protein [Candidatus Hydrogenedentota bacterium]